MDSTNMMIDEVERNIFDFLSRKYIQRSDGRQKSMDLQYMEAETHDLSTELANFIRTNYLNHQRRSHRTVD